MEHAITITGLRRISRPKPNRGGSMIIAWFDATANGFSMHDCALARTAKGGLTVWLPKIETPDGARRAFEIEDDSLRHALMAQARLFYRAMGGEHAEWTPTETREPGALAAELADR